MLISIPTGCTERMSVGRSWTKAIFLLSQEVTAQAEVVEAEVKKNLKKRKMIIFRIIESKRI